MELNDMDNYHRVVRSPFAGRPRAIVVKLSSYRAHRHLYDACTNLPEHNKRARRLADTNDVFREAGTDSREVPVPTEPPQQHAGRHPGYCATTCNPPVVSEADTDSRPNHNDADSRPNHNDIDSRRNHKAADQTIDFPSKGAIYINEVLWKSRAELRC